MNRVDLCSRGRKAATLISSKMETEWQMKETLMEETADCKKMGMRNCLQQLTLLSADLAWRLNPIRWQGFTRVLQWVYPQISG